MAGRPIAAAALLLATAVAQAPPGYKTYENKLARLTFFYPVAYQEIPQPPTEQVVVAKYVLKQPTEELKKLEGRQQVLTPEISAFLFEAEAVVTGARTDEPGGKPTNVREAMVEAGRVTTWEQFVERFEQWVFTEVPKKPGHYDLTWRDMGKENAWYGTKPVGYLVRRTEGSATFGAYGFTMAPHQKVLQGQVVKMVGSMAPAQAESGEMAAEAIDRLYANTTFRAVEQRKKARAALAKGWKAVDTENYLVVHHSKNEGLIRQIAREIEAMRLLYAQHFPAVNPVEALSVVRVCQTKDEYHQYGGPPSTGGYWHPGNEELVFFDYSYTMKTLDEDQRKAMRGRVLTSDDSLLVLYHEALHQYMHYAVGEFSPHDWFNEGYGDYYSGAAFNEGGKAVVRIDPSPWRIHLAKDMCEFGDGYVPLAALLKAERAEFYNPQRAHHYYAAAWAFVFFLKHSKEAAADPTWARILPDYFATVQESYAAQIRKVEKGGATADLEQKYVAGFNARKAALKKVTEGLDVPKLEETWRKWVVDMRDPWPSKRQKRK